jgi:hypothetical protein
MRRSPWTIATLSGYTSAERSRKRNGVNWECDTLDMEDSSPLHVRPALPSVFAVGLN